MSSNPIDVIAAKLGIPSSCVVELCDVGIVAAEGELITEATVERVRVSWTLHDELGVNLAGIEMALHLLSVIERDRVDLTNSHDGTSPSHSGNLPSSLTRPRTTSTVSCPHTDTEAMPT